MSTVDQDKQKTKEEEKFSGVVRLLCEEDLHPLKPILESWVRHRDTGVPIPEEVESDLQVMRDSLHQGIPIYLVAEAANGQVIGVIGLTFPSERMKEFTTTSAPIELINAYVASDWRGGKGVGTALVRALEEEARQRGCTEVILNSGPRYKETGWGFYDRLPGYSRVGIAERMYGEGGDALVWRKYLASA